jgi:predicted PurR-regulated permease PerM
MQKPLAWLGQHAHVSIDQVQAWILNGAKKLLQKLAASGGSVVMGAVGTVVNFLLMVFVLFFVLRDGPAVSQRVMALLPISQERRDRAVAYLADVTRAVFLGIGVTALVQGALVGVAFWITGLPSPLVFGVLAALLALVPMVGTALIWVPAAIYLATVGEYWQAIFMALWGALLVSAVDNFLRPLLISGRADVPTLAVFLGVMGGLSAFGFIGLFLGPILLGIVIALFRFEDAEISGAAAAASPPGNNGRST